jgi:hypothetical protein
MIYNTYIYYSKVDSSNELLGKISSPSRLAAAKYFAKRKNLPLKEFLKLYSVSK